MKKIVSIICIVVILFTSIIPVSASDNSKQTLTAMELSIKRITAELTGKQKKNWQKKFCENLECPNE